MRARLSTTGATSSLASGAVVREANDDDDDVEEVLAGRAVMITMTGRKEPHRRSRSRDLEKSMAPLAGFPR